MKRHRVLLALSILVVFTELAYLSIARYRGYNAGMQDLGNMAQAIWSATQGRPLIYTGPQGAWSRLALHVEAIYFLLAPLYALVPSPITLLVAQALLFVLGALPLHRLAMRHLGSTSAALIVVWVYLLYPVAQTAVLFDFHGDTLAMPLLLFALEALDQRAWRRYALWLALALCSKFYVAVPVAALGAMLYLRGERRTGLYTFLVATGWGLLAFTVIRPMFAPSERIAVQQATAVDYLSFYFGTFLDSLAFSWRARIATAVIVFLPVVWPLLRAAWWWLPTLAIGIPPLLSSGPGPSHHYGYHHYALVVPFAIVGSVYGIVEMKRRNVGWWARGNRLTAWPLALSTMALLTLGLNSTFLETALNPDFWNRDLGALTDPMQYARTSRDGVKDLWVRQHVPVRSALSASAYIAPHVVSRETLYVMGQGYLPEHAEEVDYIVADALFDHVQMLDSAQFVGGVDYEWEEIAWALKHPEFGLVRIRDGLLLFERNVDGALVLMQSVEKEPIHDPSQPLQVFGDDIALVDFYVEPISERVRRLGWCWLPLQSLQDKATRFAVSRLEGVSDARFVHLPTSVLMPTPLWDKGYAVCERFDIELPEGLSPGIYPLLVGWYDSGHPAAAATDERSRVGEELKVGAISLP